MSQDYQHGPPGTFWISISGERALGDSVTPSLQFNLDYYTSASMLFPLVTIVTIMVCFILL